MSAGFMRTRYMEVAAMRLSAAFEPTPGARCLADITIAGVRAVRSGRCLSVKASGRIELEVTELGRTYRVITDRVNVRRA